MKQENLRGVSLLELSTSSSSGVLVASADDIVTCCEIPGDEWRESLY